MCILNINILTNVYERMLQKPPDGHCSGRYASYWNEFLLPPANEVWGKVMFLQVSVILFPGGSTWSRGEGGAWSWGVPGPRAAPGPRGSPGPQPRGKLRGIWSRPTIQGEVEGIWSRPTTKGEVEGDLVQAHTQGGSGGGSGPGPHPRGS